jgi:hypothetical protein
MIAKEDEERQTHQQQKTSRAKVSTDLIRLRASLMDPFL